MKILFTEKNKFISMKNYLDRNQYFYTAECGNGCYYITIMY